MIDIKNVSQANKREPSWSEIDNAELRTLN